MARSIQSQALEFHEGSLTGELGELSAYTEVLKRGGRS